MPRLAPPSIGPAIRAKCRQRVREHKLQLAEHPPVSVAFRTGLQRSSQGSMMLAQRRNSAGSGHAGKPLAKTTATVAAAVPRLQVLASRAVRRYCIVVPAHVPLARSHERQDEAVLEPTSTHHQPPPGAYTYIVLPGNNAKVVVAAMDKRPWWHRTGEADTLFNFKWKPTLSPPLFTSRPCNASHKQVINHFPRNRELCSKAGLLTSMRALYARENREVYTAVPVSFILSSEYQDQEYCEFQTLFRFLEARNNAMEARPSTSPARHVRGKATGETAAASCATTRSLTRSRTSSSLLALRIGSKQLPLLTPQETRQNLWIIKPNGQNRGRGISIVSSVAQVDKVLRRAPAGSRWIVQKYIEQPMLISGRKFDIRCFVLVTANMTAYMYHDGYLRTSSQIYTTDDPSNTSVHLTNNAVQKHDSSYGIYEEGNQLSLQEWEAYLQAGPGGATWTLERNFWPRVRQLAAESIKSVRKSLNSARNKLCFELFGYDFMLDDQQRIWLVEVNTNPCLETPSPLLRKLIPELLDDALGIVLDPVFPAPAVYRSQARSSKASKFAPLTCQT